MRFRNREDAARQLAARLARYSGQRPLVLGVPRGAVPIAAIVAETLGGDLDVVLVRKLGAPGQPELAIGAVDESGTVVRGRYFDLAPAEWVRQEAAAQLATLGARRARYTRARPPLSPAGRLVILVDDGVATGASLEAAIRAVRAQGPATLVAAVGVAPPHTLARLRPLVDDLVCLYATEDFAAVGQFYDDFGEVTDADVVDVLARPASPGTATAGPSTSGAA